MLFEVIEIVIELFGKLFVKYLNSDHRMTRRYKKREKRDVRYAKEKC